MNKKAANTGDRVLDRYVDAVHLVEQEIKKTVPIKVSHFTKDNKVDHQFFKFLIELKAIEEIMRDIKGGALYEWIYKPASNEADHALAVKVLTKVRAYQAADNAKRRDPKYMFEKAQKDAKKGKGKGAKDTTTSDDTQTFVLKGGSAVVQMTRQQKVDNHLQFLLKDAEERLKGDTAELQAAQAKYNKTHRFVQSLREQLGITDTNNEPAQTPIHIKATDH